MGSKYAIQVFQEAFLGDRDGHRMGLPNVPLSEVYRNAVAAFCPPATSNRTNGMRLSWIP